MYRMIIADDEAVVRAGLTHILEWEEYGVEIVGEAADGAQALKLIDELHPDLMLLDIEMPVFSGLDVLEMLQGRPGAPKVIVLSGYDHFDYVRRSMRLGAQNYLLKPLDVSELKETVNNVISVINDTNARKMQFPETLGALRNTLLDRLLHGHIELKELREKCKLLGITLRTNRMQVWLLRPLFDNEDVTLRHIMFESLEICSVLAEERGYRGYFVADSDDNIAGIMILDERAPGGEEIDAFLEECGRRIRERSGCLSIPSYGQPVTLYRDLPLSYRSALNMQGFRSICEDENPDSSERPLFDEQQLARDMRAQSAEGLRGDVRAFCRNLAEQPGEAPFAWKYHAVSFICCAMWSMPCPPSHREMRRFREYAYRSIRDARDLRMLETLLGELVSQLERLGRRGQSGQYSPLVRAALESVDREYGDPNLSIKTLAAELGASAAYLGRLFRQEVGCFFTDYLNDARVAAASALLMEGSMRTADVAEAVGFTNLSYFHTVFKKYAGCAPGAMRRQGDAAARGKADTHEH